jgi:hypothetical protein
MSDSIQAPEASAPDPFEPPPVGVPAARPAYGLSAPAGELPGQESFESDGAPLGKIREAGPCVALFICTLGLYSLVWYYKTFTEMKRHSGQGIGGVWAILMIIPGVILLYIPPLVLPFLCAGEVGKLYERRGAQPPVGAQTGVWIFLPLAGGIIWWLKVQNALNEYWARSGQTTAA